MINFQYLKGIGFASILAFVPMTLHAQDMDFPSDLWQRYDTVERAGFSEKGIKALDQTVSSMNTHSMMVITNGKVAYEYGDLETTTYVASVRKSVLAMLYGPYVKDGTINLDATLSDIGIDDAQGLLDIEKQATIDHLVTARSGIYHPASNGGDNTADAPERGSQQPGTYFLYNNWDFNASGAIFEKLTGKNIYDALNDQMVGPLNMQDFDLQKHLDDGKTGNLERSHFPAYHMHFSTRDLARVGHLMLNKGVWDGQRLYDEAWIEKIVSTVTPKSDMNPMSVRQGDFGYGYMWWVFDKDTNAPEYEGAYAGRGHYGQYLVVLPKLNMVISHKTMPQRYSSPEEYAKIRVTWPQMKEIVDAVLAARAE